MDVGQEFSENLSHKKQNVGCEVTTKSVDSGDSSVNHGSTKMRWSPRSWQDGTRKSAFQPYKPTTVLTNLQRGNIPTETPVTEQVDLGFHHRAGLGEINEADIRQEADVDAADTNGLTALMWASSYGQVPTVQLLLQHGASINKQGPEGETALLLAAAGGHHDVVRILLTEGASVNHADDVGNTALIYAAHGDHPHCTNELLIRGADLTIMNLNDDTAYGVAVSEGSKLAQQVIENHILTLLN
ncbi:ankyrin repeat family A protein 2-like isoform X1 [Schistocerca cancellata]|uniref:ankyrin repeat family A protein 2-like isoform X1 n=1 Tax=Schistocerca cancellata TaxID=274614 RepID=UPI0021176A37|nr:ankyrin repeat family A protein 2-like isoform X1 [Schistocerca cancellata]